jgi:hypothetical protein
MTQRTLNSCALAAILSNKTVASTDQLQVIRADC